MCGVAVLVKASKTPGLSLVTKLDSDVTSRPNLASSSAELVQIVCTNRVGFRK